jgi:hypothetical protein
LPSVANIFPGWCEGERRAGHRSQSPAMSLMSGKSCSKAFGLLVGVIEITDEDDQMIHAWLRATAAVRASFRARSVYLRGSMLSD